MEMQNPDRWSAKRKEAGKQRKNLGPPATLLFAPENGPNPSVFTKPPPGECVLAATDAQGAVAGWCNPEFFREMHRHWGRHHLTVRLSATPGAMLNEMILEQFTALRQAAPTWRLVAESDGTSLASTAAVDRLLKSPYHEIVLRLGFLPPDEQQRGGEALGNQRVFLAIRQLIELRKARGQDEPSVVWVFQTAEVDERLHQRAAQIARQLQVDRFEKPDLVT